MICKKCNYRNKVGEKNCVCCGEALGVETTEDKFKRNLHVKFKTANFIIYIVSLICCSLSYLIMGIGVCVINASKSIGLAVTLGFTFLPLAITAAISAVKGILVCVAQTPSKKHVGGIGVFGKCQKIIGIVWLIELMGICKMVETSEVYFVNPIFLFATAPIAILSIPAGRTVYRNFCLLEEMMADGKDRLDKLLSGSMFLYIFCIFMGYVAITWFVCVFRGTLDTTVVLLTVLMCVVAVHYLISAIFVKDVESVRVLMKEETIKAEKEKLGTYH